MIKFLTVEEFAERLQMHPGSIRRAIRKGRIYALRPAGGKRAPYRIADTEIERLHLQCMCEPKKEMNH